MKSNVIPKSSQSYHAATADSLSNALVVRFVAKPSPIELKAIGRLRAEVWNREGIEVIDFEGGDAKVWLDELDAYAHHWLVYDGDKLVAAARVSVHEERGSVPDFAWLQPVIKELTEPIGSLMRLVVSEEYRCLGIASHLDALRLRFLLSSGVGTAVGIAVGLSRIKALEKHGFVFKYLLPENHGLMKPNFPLGVLLYQAD